MQGLNSGVLAATKTSQASAQSRVPSAQCDFLMRNQLLDYSVAPRLGRDRFSKLVILS